MWNKESGPDIWFLVLGAAQLTAHLLSVGANWKPQLDHLLDPIKTQYHNNYRVVLHYYNY